MRFIIVLLALMLALPAASSGEGTDVPVDAFIARTGIDETLRGKVGDFLRDRGITARTIIMIDDGRLSRYAEHLTNDLPVSYDDLLDAPSTPLPEGAQIHRLAVHAYQQTADAMHFYGMPLRILLIDIGSRKRINIVSNQLPAAKVEVADAKVGSFDTEIRENGLEAILELYADVVDNLRHFPLSCSPNKNKTIPRPERAVPECRA